MAHNLYEPGDRAFDPSGAWLHDRQDGPATIVAGGIILVALVIAVPCLTIIANAASLGGGMIVAWIYSEIPPQAFIDRLRAGIDLSTIFAGLIKAPFMALMAASASCGAEKETKPLKGESQKDLEKWLACWERMEIMDVHLWPLWEKEVHDIMHPLFKELQLIFLAYTRSISEDSAEDAMEMSLDEFHDFVVDVGLETKQYKFDVMCNQFIKANATNVAAVREHGLRGAEQQHLRLERRGASRSARDGREPPPDTRHLPRPGLASLKTVRDELWAWTT